MTKDSITKKWLNWSGKEMKNHNIETIATEYIIPGQFQPRSNLDEDKLENLCQTIRIHGIMQPIMVRKKDELYELIAGERRWRAAKKLNLPTVPAIVYNWNDLQVATAALVENLEREDLSAIEEAKAYQKLLKIQGGTQEALAKWLGKSPSTLANKLRLLQLSTHVQSALLHKRITERHGRTLLLLKDKELEKKILEKIIKNSFSVKDTEEYIKKIMDREKTIKKSEETKISRTSKKDLHSACNTIRRSVKIVQKTGFDVEVEERPQDTWYEILIRIPR